MIERFKKWLKSDIVCIHCNNIFHIFMFGYGKGICLDCYNGENKFIFLDKSYWLNRLIIRLNNGFD